MFEDCTHPKWCFVLGPIIAILGGTLLYRIGHLPTLYGLLLGAPFGMAFYASMFAAMDSDPSGQNISLFGVVVLFVFVLTFYDKTTGSAAITMGLMLFVLGGIDLA